MESPHAKASKLEKSNSSSSSSSDEDFIELDASKSVADTSNHGGSQLASGVDLGVGSPLSPNAIAVTQSPPSQASGADLGAGSPLSPNAITVTQSPPSQASGVELGAESPLSPNAIVATQSPPNQVMERSDEPDPHRIPSSVFAMSKSTSPMEWSVASNESLFSIHMGNSSFSKDDGFLNRSGEFSNLSSPSLLSPVELFSPSTTSGESRKSDFGEGLQSPGATEAANAETMKEVLRAAADEHSQADEQRNEAGHVSATLSQRSESTASARSFAFPVLAEGKNGSVKVNPEQPLQPPEQQQLPESQQQQQESQQQASEAAPNAEETRLFPCFSCCPFCC